jgi:hypothetical protein
MKRNLLLLAITFFCRPGFCFECKMDWFYYEYFTNAGVRTISPKTKACDAVMPKSLNLKDARACTDLVIKTVTDCCKVISPELEKVPQGGSFAIDEWTTEQVTTARYFTEIPEDVDLQVGVKCGGVSRSAAGLKILPYPDITKNAYSKVLAYERIRLENHRASLAKMDAERKVRERSGKVKLLPFLLPTLIRFS